MVLKALAENTKLWMGEDINSDNLIELLEEYKLPATQKDLRALLQLDSK